jgi:hypothetical protein
MLAGHNQPRLRNPATDILTYVVLRRDDAAAAAGAGGAGGVVGRAVGIDAQMSAQAMQLANETLLSLRGASHGAAGQGDQFSRVVQRRFKIPPVAQPENIRKMVVAIFMKAVELVAQYYNHQTQLNKVNFGRFLLNSIENLTPVQLPPNTQLRNEEDDDDDEQQRKAAEPSLQVGR